MSSRATYRRGRRGIYGSWAERNAGCWLVQPGSPCLRIDATFARRRLGGNRGISSASLVRRPRRCRWRARGNAAGLDRTRLERSSIASAFSSTRSGARRATDLAGTLAQLAKIGYKEIELAGYYNHPATEVRDDPESNGLTAPSGHIAIEAIETTPAQTFADAKTVGHEWITVPSLPRGPEVTVDDWKGVADRFNKAAAREGGGLSVRVPQPQRPIVKKDGDVLPIDILMKETDPSLVSFEMDIYWVVNGGGESAGAARGVSGAVQDVPRQGFDGGAGLKMADVGAGTIDFKTIFARAKEGHRALFRRARRRGGRRSRSAAASYTLSLQSGILVLTCRNALYTTSVSLAPAPEAAWPPTC